MSTAATRLLASTPPADADLAAERAPEATFLEGDLRALPLPDGGFDLVVCGLALAHLADVRPAVAELARVLGPGGRLVISVLHPFQAHLGWQAPYADADGGRGFVREHPHTHADYLEALSAAGLELGSCLEPALTADGARAKRRAFRHIPEATIDAYRGLPPCWCWRRSRGER